MDVENQADKVPRDFKALFIGGPNQTYILVGGFDYKRKRISNNVFTYENGFLKE